MRSKSSALKNISFPQFQVKNPLQPTGDFKGIKGVRARDAVLVEKRGRVGTRQYNGRHMRSQSGKSQGELSRHGREEICRESE